MLRPSYLTANLLSACQEALIILVTVLRSRRLVSQKNIRDTFSRVYIYIYTQRFPKGEILNSETTLTCKVKMLNNCRLQIETSVIDFINSSFYKK